ncbi:MAG TPA: hypothetical protein VMU27_02860 [Candidatus Paceibacterota bacterium]|nr:hypothetical protein [Candidatus Paceibacterota bacterium]
MGMENFPSDKKRKNEDSKKKTPRVDAGFDQKVLACANGNRIIAVKFDAELANVALQFAATVERQHNYCLLIHSAQDIENRAEEANMFIFPRPQMRILHQEVGHVGVQHCLPPR